MFRIIFTFYLAILLHTLLAAPVDQNSDIDEIAYEIEYTVKNITEIYYVDNDSVNKTKGYIEKIISNIKRKGNGTIESINELKNKLLETLKVIKSIANAKASNAYGDVIEKTSIYFEILNTELKNFLEDIKPSVKKIGSSIGKMLSTVTDSAGSILDSFRNRIGSIVNG